MPNQKLLNQLDPEGLTNEEAAGIVAALLAGANGATWRSAFATAAYAQPSGRRGRRPAAYSPVPNG